MIMDTKEENPNFIYDSNIYDSELPYVSILMPTWNRRKFLPLILINLYNMDYPKDKLELVIYDDHTENPLFNNQEEARVFSNHLKIKVNYIYNKTRHLTIGEKRNKLVKLANHKVCINMDDDDIYFSTYIKYSVNLLTDNKAGIVGSPEMLFTFPHYNNETAGIRCEAKRQCHEATFCFTKKYWKCMGGFNKKGNGEGAKMIDFNEKSCVKSDITKCMCCVAHVGNTVDKNQFRGANKEALEMEIPDVYKDMLNKILEINI